MCLYHTVKNCIFLQSRGVRYFVLWLSLLLTTPVDGIFPYGPTKDWVILYLTTSPSWKRWWPQISFNSSWVRHPRELNYASVSEMSLCICKAQRPGPADCRSHTWMARKHFSIYYKWLTVWKLSWMVVNVLETDSVFKFGGQQFAWAASC